MSASRRPICRRRVTCRSNRPSLDGCRALPSRASCWARTSSSLRSGGRVEIPRRVSADYPRHRRGDPSRRRYADLIPPATPDEDPTIGGFGAAATRTSRGADSRRRRGRDVDIRSRPARAGPDVAAALSEVCEIEVTTIEANWDDCWGDNVIGDGTLQGWHFAARTFRGRVAATPRGRREYSAETRRGDAAAATCIFR